MADNEIYTEQQMLDYARGTLEEWVQGYTDVEADGRQRRIRTLDVDDDSITVKVQRQQMHGGYDRREKAYKITLKVEEVEHGAKD